MSDWVCATIIDDDDDDYTISNCINTKLEKKIENILKGLQKLKKRKYLVSQLS